jgi:hypothetical protein
MDGPDTEKLACALAMNSVYVPSARHPTLHRDFGVAVLSPWPLDDARVISTAVGLPTRSPGPDTPG